MGIKTVVVLGVHRSGTSLLAGMIYRLGVDLGKTLLPPSDYCKYGYFEDKEIVEAHDKLLTSAGFSWNNPPIGEEETFFALYDPRRLNHISDIIKRNTLAHKDSMWGWKDPRTILALRMYCEDLVDPGFVVVHRNLLSVTNSISRVYGLSFNNALHIAGYYSFQITAFLSTMAVALRAPVQHYMFENIIEKPEEIVDSLISFLKLDVSSTKRAHAIGLADRREKHF